MTTTKEIVILVGPPGSGKSTFAHELMNNYWANGFLTSRISQDDQGKGHLELFNKAIENGIHLIVVDRMGFDLNQRNRYLDPARKAGYKTRIVVFHVPKDTCYERIMAREDHPTINGSPEEKSKIAYSALGTFFKNYQRVQDSEADVVERKGWTDRGRALVVDIDGTIANIEHRRHWVDRTGGKKANWMKFFDDMGLDTPNQWCVDIVKAIWSKSGNMTPEQQPYEIVFASGRPDNYRLVTEMWLNEVLGYKFYRHLFMRRRDDSRQDNFVKEIILDFELKTRWKNLLFLDDRKQVVDMYRSHGYTVLQCDVGDF